MTPDDVLTVAALVGAYYVGRTRPVHTFRDHVWRRLVIAPAPRAERGGRLRGAAENALMCVCFPVTCARALHLMWAQARGRAPQTPQRAPINVNPRYLHDSSVEPQG